MRGGDHDSGGGSGAEGSQGSEDTSSEDSGIKKGGIGAETSSTVREDDSRRGRKLSYRVQKSIFVELHRHSQRSESSNFQ